MEGVVGGVADSGGFAQAAADVLEAPDLATRDKPGLIGGALVWGSRSDSAQTDRWQPLTG